MAGERHWRCLLVPFVAYYAPAALYKVGAVGRVLECQCEERELLRKAFHMWILLLCSIEYQAAVTVQGLQVGLDTGGLVCLALAVTLDDNVLSSVAAHLLHQGTEHLLEEWILQGAL